MHHTTSIISSCICTRSITHHKDSKYRMNLVIVRRFRRTVSVPQKRVDMVRFVDISPAAPSIPRPVDHLVPIATLAVLAHANRARVRECHGSRCIVGMHMISCRRALTVMLPCQVQGHIVAQLKNDSRNAACVAYASE